MSENKEILNAEDVKELAPLYEKVVLALKQVYDPEIPVNIYDLGLIYELNINKQHEAFVRMTFTAPNCPAADFILEDINQKLTSIQGVKNANVEVVFEPEWNKDMMSEEAKLDLGFM